MREVTCRKCGWVHMAMTKKEILARGYDLKDVNRKCFGYGCKADYRNMRTSKPGDAPRGVTIQLILDPEE